MDPDSARNGSLMRLAPVVLFAYPDITQAVELAAASSVTTHGAPEAVDACRLLAFVIHRALEGAGGVGLEMVGLGNRLGAVRP